MSVDELKRIVDEASPSERVFLTTYAAAKLRAEDTAHRHAIESAHDRIEAGQSISLATAKRLAEELDQAGL